MERSGDLPAEGWQGASSHWIERVAHGGFDPLEIAGRVPLG
ncbi:hypothetical protein SF83666_c12580 [Sinorhizobium fredii CCBAU 83666]|nr:hypothetical protein SF83666_c12580 [Sinorhizobium fredii CCBAU 83666]